MEILQADTVFITDEDRTRAGQLPVGERQLIIKNLLVPYSTYNRGYEAIRSLHMPVAGGLPNLGVVGGLIGPSRCGKTIICESYVAHHPQRDGETGVEYPVVCINASIDMSRRQVGARVHRFTSSPHRILTRTDPIEWTVDRLLKCKTELLIVDDAQYLFFEHRRAWSATEMFGVVKDVLDTKKISVMLVGDGRINNFVFDVDAFKNRGYRSSDLEPLSNTRKDLEKFGALLTSIDRRLPFSRSSELAQYRDDFHRYSEGRIGLVMNVVQEAAFRALNDRTACILVEHLRAAVRSMVRPGDDANYFGYKSRAN